MDEARSESNWRAVSRLFVLGAVLLVAGCQAVLPSPSGPRTPRPTPEPVSKELPREFKGFGRLSTEAFALGGGRYAIDWSLTPVPGYPCRHWVQLENDRGQSDLVLDLFIGADERIYDTTYAWDLAPGRYHFHVISTCDWTLLIDEDDEPS
ncbi:MAG TPA: hypothetical protein VIH19_02150 [Candidatus Limnocylindria bacterium]